MFLRKFVCQPLCCVPLQIQTFYYHLVLVAEYSVVMSAVTNFQCDKLIAKANNRKNSDMKIVFAVSIGKDTPFLSTKISKFVDE